MASNVTGKQVNDIGVIEDPAPKKGVSHNIRGDIMSIMKGDTKSE